MRFLSLTSHTLSRQHRLICYWLLLLLMWLLLMVVIGAVTRLTDSGLSMVEWRPLIGAIPPLSQAEWLRVFTLYQQIPEYQQLPSAVDLQDFKRIFFWEYLHRLWGRSLGIVFFVPWGYLWAKGMLQKSEAIRLLVIPLLGLAQAVIGWWMVKSGFSERVDVSQYRLLIHLSLALLIVMIVWEQLLRYAGIISGKINLWNYSILRQPTLWFLLLVILTMIVGGLVAGTRAGLIYNEFPLMAGQWIAPDYIPHTGASLRVILFENPASLQFHHRLLAMLTFACGLYIGWRYAVPYKPALLIILSGQFLLGIITLLTQLNTLFATLHQFGAVSLLMLSWLMFRKITAKNH